MSCTIYVANTNTIEVLGLKSAVTGDWINDGVLTMTICALDDEGAPGEPVDGQDWPWPMAYLAASNGNYRGVLQDGAALEAGVRYVAVIEADAGPDNIAHWEFQFTAETRRGD